MVQVECLLEGDPMSSPGVTTDCDTIWEISHHRAWFDASSSVIGAAPVATYPAYTMGPGLLVGVRHGAGPYPVSEGTVARVGDIDKKL